MKITLLSSSFLLLVGFAASTIAQAKPSPLDRYFHEASTIVVAKCLRVGAVNILLRANVDIEVIRVVKGGEVPETITVDSQYGMAVGNYYLLAFKGTLTSTAPFLTLNTRDSVIPIISADEVEQLKKLPPRIVVLRTMNLRVDQLESEIRVREFELQALKNARKEN